MSLSDINELVRMYARTAKKAKSVGFSGVLIHAGHGFLLSQFLSPLFNHRTDKYGGSIENRSRIVIEVIKAVRDAVGPSYPVGIRINSSDLLKGGLTEADALIVVQLLDKTSIDLIDISGGTYFPGAKASSDSAGKGPYFLGFARLARKVTNIPLLLTGGFKNLDQAVDVIASGIVDMVGLGRVMVLNPRLPENWLSGNECDIKFPRFKKIVPGGMTAWYTMRLVALGENMESEYNLDLLTAISQYEKRESQRCIIWNSKFSTPQINMSFNS